MIYMHEAYARHMCKTHMAHMHDTCARNIRMTHMKQVWKMKKHVKECKHIVSKQFFKTNQISFSICFQFVSGVHRYTAGVCNPQGVMETSSLCRRTCMGSALVGFRFGSRTATPASGALEMVTWSFSMTHCLSGFFRGFVTCLVLIKSFAYFCGLWITCEWFGRELSSCSSLWA